MLLKLALSYIFEMIFPIKFIKQVDVYMKVFTQNCVCILGGEIQKVFIYYTILKSTNCLASFRSIRNQYFISG